MRHKLRYGQREALVWFVCLFPTIKPPSYFQWAIRYGVVSLWRQLSVTINESVTFRDNTKTNSKEQSRGEFIIVHPIPGSSVLPTAPLRNSLAGVRAPTLRLKNFFKFYCSRSQWPRGLKRRSMAARLLGLWFRILPGAWKSVCCECFVLSGRGLYDELITRPDESYRLWCVVVCDLENLMNEEPFPINVIELNIGDTSLDVFPTCR